MLAKCSTIAVGYEHTVPNTIAEVRQIFAFVSWLRVHQHRHALPKDVEIICDRCQTLYTTMQVELFTSPSNSQVLCTYITLRLMLSEHASEIVTVACPLLCA